MLEKVPFKPRIYCRYVDDIFCIIPRKYIDTMVNIFKSYHKKIDFTYELQVDNKISFLDVLISNEEGNLVTNWYCKPTYSGRVLNFYSNHPISQKKAMVYNLVDRAILLSSPKFHQDNISTVKKILLANFYPSTFVQKYIDLRIKKHSSNSPPKEKTKIPTIYITLPFYNNSMKKFDKLINESDFKKKEVKVVFKTTNKLNNIIKKGKDKLKREDQHNVIYKINCKNCDKCYIGQTYRRLQKRVNEHKSYTSGVIANHRLSKTHDMNWEKVQILDRETDYYKRDISEMLHIKSEPNTINAQTDTNRLRKIFDCLL